MAGVGTAMALAGLNRDLALSQVISHSSQPEVEKWRMEAEHQRMARADMEVQVERVRLDAALANVAWARAAAMETRAVAAEAENQRFRDLITQERDEAEEEEYCMYEEEADEVADEI